MASNRTRATEGDVMKHSDEINHIAPAWVKAQQALQKAAKDASNPAFRSKYADLPAVCDAAYPALHANGLAVMQDVATTEAGVEVTTRVLHTSGQWFEFGPITIPLSKRDAHGVGSGTTYGRRFGLSAAVGVVADDDDGNAAVGRSHDKPASFSVPAPATVVQATTGEEVPLAKAEAPAGYHYLSDYRQNGEWHEAHLLKWDAQGGSLRVSTKRASLGQLMAQFCQDGVPVKADVTIKKTNKGEAYLNALHTFDVVKGLMTPPAPLTDIDADSIPF